MHNNFEIIKQSKKSGARVCKIHTPHGDIVTPSFVPVATNATMKSFDSHYLNALDIDLVFCNTYHLLLHPGPDVVHGAGGLHSFMQRSKPLITDSGGFQIFSLMYGGVTQELKSKGTKSYKNSVLSVNEEGVIFRSYRDGSLVKLTPEISVSIQKKLGADIIIPLDELIPYHTEEQYLQKSFDRTHRWQLRSLHEHKKSLNGQIMYGVVHGGIREDLRKKSCSFIEKEGFDGFAIGGSLGKNSHELNQVLEYCKPCMPEAMPRHLLGMGDKASIDAGVLCGIDTFDSSYPTKCARHGLILSDQGVVKIEQARWKHCYDHFSQAPGCQGYSYSYLHHLFKAHEYVGCMLASIHNTFYMAKYMKNIRLRIMDGIL